VHWADLLLTTPNLLFQCWPEGWPNDDGVLEGLTRAILIARIDPSQIFQRFFIASDPELALAGAWPHDMNGNESEWTPRYTHSKGR
jgi:hypothetical protein